MENFSLKVTSAKEKIINLRKEDSLVFPIITDLHVEDAECEFMDRLIPALELISAEIEYDALINLGDNFAMLGRDTHISNEELNARFEQLLSVIHKAVKHPIININGNHDGIGTDFFKPDFWKSIVKHRYGNTSAVYSNSGCYYYIDYEKANTRLVILSLPFDSDIECENPTPFWKFGENQLDWLKNEALNTKKDVIILSHVPFYYKYSGDMEAMLEVWDGKNAKMSYISALCGWIEDLDEAVQIINEFAKQSDTRLVGVLSGHMHIDEFFFPLEQKGTKKNPLPCHQVVTKATCFTVGAKNKNSISIDVAVWTPSENELNIIRIGAGEDEVRRIKL